MTWRIRSIACSRGKPSYFDYSGDNYADVSETNEHVNANEIERLEPNIVDDTGFFETFQYNEKTNMES